MKLGILSNFISMSYYDSTRLINCSDFCIVPERFGDVGLKKHYDKERGFFLKIKLGEFLTFERFIEITRKDFLID